MKKFTCVQDIGNLKSAVEEALTIKKDRFKYVELGRNKTLMMIFFNSSLRTRLSTQKAAFNLGLNVMVLDINQGAWKLETERGVIMDGDKPEHLLEAIPVMGCYCDIIGVRSFARFESRDFDYQETILNQFISFGMSDDKFVIGGVHPFGKGVGDSLRQRTGMRRPRHNHFRTCRFLIFFNSNQVGKTL